MSSKLENLTIRLSKGETRNDIVALNVIKSFTVDTNKLNSINKEIFIVQQIRMISAEASEMGENG